MKIESVDFFYLSMPEVLDIGDGSQDALLVRVRTNTGAEGWGECESSPLTSIAGWCTPMSHSACKPVSHSVLGKPVDEPSDIRRLTSEVRRNSFDLLQADHTFSGVEIALWDLLGRHLEQPAWKLLGWNRSFPKVAYASQLFGDTPEQTYQKAVGVRSKGFRAAKFGWGPFGINLAADEAQVRAAREGLGPHIELMVDAGTIWGEDVAQARLRVPVLEECRVTWLEEPFVSGALKAYRELGKGLTGKLRTAGGEGAHDPFVARNLMDFGGLGFVQIDAGRIGGLESAYSIARYAQAHDIRYVNHTFTTPLALSASLQPYAGLESSVYCEYPTEASAMARNLTTHSPVPDDDGMVRISDLPGLGMTLRKETLLKYLRTVEIRLSGKLIHQTASLD
jgi:L-alanine-DL-glutamate epimerase-like enolase superfamily enzyme